jgi:flavin reductase (DIM6/NTAB) family NADH-FMN oxidoreductase RutF
MNRMQAAPAIDRDVFRKACGRFATGIAVATVAGADGTPYGLTVNSFTSVSCCPPLVLICVDYRCSILPAFRSSNWYGINVLRDTQRDLSVRFSQRQPDRFEGLDWYRGDSGVPLLRMALASMECCVTQTVEAGDHAILIAEVMRADWRDGEPLLYFASGYRSLASDGKHK